MQARITRFKMRPDAVEAAESLMQELRGEIMGQPGVGKCMIVMNGDGSGHVVTLIDDRGGSPESVDRVRVIWHKFHDHLEAVPEPEIFTVVADWSN